MEFSFLKFWGPSFFVLNTKTTMTTLSLSLSAFEDLDLILFSMLKHIIEYETYLSVSIYWGDNVRPRESYKAYDASCS